MIKKILMVALVWMMMFATTAWADEQIPGEYPEVTGVMGETMVVEPRFTYIGYVTAGLDIDENGLVIYGGSSRAPYYNMRITVHLQRSSNGLFWEEIFSHIKTGYDNVGLEETMYVEENQGEEECDACPPAGAGARRDERLRCQGGKGGGNGCAGCDRGPDR